MTTELAERELELAQHLTVNEQTCQAQLNCLAPKAVSIIGNHLKGRRRRLSPSMQRAAEYVIDHAIGKAKVKVEHSGGVMTYADLTRGVEELEKAPPRLLIAVQVNVNQPQQTVGPSVITTTASVSKDVP